MKIFQKPAQTPFPRVKTPTMLQMEAVECGAASLGMVLGYYGLYLPLEELRQVCGISRDGSKASNLVKAAQRYGLLAKGFKKKPASIREMRFPLIVFWNFNHFLVVEGIKGNEVYLNDPASGPRRVAWEEFDQSFTGVVLTFEPGPDFKPGGAHPNILAALRRRLTGSEAALTFVVLAGLGLVVPGLVIPTFTRVFVDQYLVGGLENWVMPLLIGMGLTALLRAGFTWVQEYYLLRLETGLSLATSGQFFWHILRLPIAFYDQRYRGEIGARVALNDRIAQLLSGELATTLINAVLILFYAILMFQYDVTLTLIGIGIAALNLVGLRAVARRRVDSNQKLLQDRGKLLGTALGGLQSIETLKASGGETDFFAAWSGYQAKVINTEQRLGVFTQVLAVFPPLLDSLNTLMILILGGNRIMNGDLTMGELVAFQSLMISFMAPIRQLVNLGGTLQEIQGDLGRLEDVLRYEPDPQTNVSDASPLNAQTTMPLKLSGQVEVRGLTFGYSPLDPPLIEDFNLHLQPGSRVALVGGSGSGKSTVARLIAGLYQPWAGEILFDGVPREQLPRDRLSNSLAMVDQEIFLFEGRVRENLSLWDTTLPETQMTRAAKDARIHHEIVAKPSGYDYRLAEGGRNFSGGQAQRLEIARALAGNPTLLILDEATSALDATTEKEIDDQLRQRGCTCIIVAHRLSTIRDADEIIVLEHGKIVQRGTHEALLAAENSLYARLIETDLPPAALPQEFVY